MHLHPAIPPVTRVVHLMCCAVLCCGMLLTVPRCLLCWTGSSPRWAMPGLMWPTCAWPTTCLMHSKA
jgi:hypothetical protein